MPDVFVSYARGDSEFVRGLVERLEGVGKSVWIDTGNRVQFAYGE